MKISARSAPDDLHRRLARLGSEVEAAALAAADEALAIELNHAREPGSPGPAPVQWLAPVLPGARAPMRAAALKAVARALSRFKRRA